MSTDAWLWIPAAIVLVAVLIQAFFSRLQTALNHARRGRLAQLAEGDSRLRAAEGLLENPGPFQAAAHITTTFCEAITYSAAAVVGLAVTARGRAQVETAELLRAAAPWVLLALFLAALAVLLLGEALPKTVATREPERILLGSAAFMGVYSTIMSPLLLVIRWVGRAAARLLRVRADDSSPEARTEEEIRLIVGGSADQGEIEPEEKEMIHSIFDLTETPTRQIMVPRVEIQGVEAAATVMDAAKMMLEHGHSRAPVYEDTLDKIVGVLHVKDLIPLFLDGNRQLCARDLVRDPFFVPENKKIDDLLAEFKQHRTQMAIVVDEFGGTSGLVTLEDVLEEIVGEIQDEYDVEEPAIHVVDEQTWVVDAHMPVDDVNEELDLSLPTGDYDTLGGFVFHLFGRPPEVGEQVTHGGLEFTVEQTDGPRILRVRVYRSAEAPPETAPPGAPGTPV